MASLIQNERRSSNSMVIRHGRRSRRLTLVKRVLAAPLLTAALSAVVVAVPSAVKPAAAATGSATFNYTGGPQYFAVPANVHELLIEAWGAQGGGDGGQGGYVRGFLPVTPSESLQINVGGQGITGGAGGWNGGGNRGGGTWTPPSGGGGATDIRQGGPSRMIVAGGGGGNAHSQGGLGGYPAGTRAGDNGLNSSEQGAEGGYGGTQSAGGWGGFGFCGTGWAGFAGQGGNGGYNSGFAGGGGGGGYYGGGGGGAGCNWGGTGGGGGSSFASAVVTDVVYDAGARYGDGMVVITWSPDAWPARLTTPGSLTDPTGTIAVDPLNKEASIANAYGLENNGDSDVSTLDVPYVTSPDVVAAKEALVARLQPVVAYEVGTGLLPITGRQTMSSPPSCPDGCPPPSKVLSQPLTYQQRNYWCGPTAAQLVLQQMTGSSPSQAQLSAEEGTEKQQKTSWDAVAKALNNHLGREVFYGKVVSSSNEYLSVVSAATHWENHSVINNITSSPALEYWGPPGTKPSGHFNITHGYSFGSGGTVRVADEYDITKVPTSRTVNPYGYHTVPATQMWQAVRDNKGIVLW
jgi:hypothetical protein